MIDMTKLTRSKIRYALYRNRSGGPDQDHKDVLEYYSKELKQFGLSISEFPDSWDIGVNNPLEIVSGHLLIPLKAKTEASLFNTDGSLKI